jgi:hypothetical protein
MKTWLGLLLILVVGVSRLPADSGMPRVRADVVVVPKSSVTVDEGLRYLDSRPCLVTPEEFRRWTGVSPVNGPFKTRWRLRDGVLYSNNFQLPDGKIVIMCYGRETPGVR